MPSDELRRAVSDDETLRQLLDELTERVAQVDPMAFIAVVLDASSNVPEFLGLSTWEAEALEDKLRSTAREYAERFPEIQEAASFLAPPAN